MFGDIGTRLGDRLGHRGKDLMPRLACLVECLLEHFKAHVGLLDVHLQGGNPVMRSGHLEVHVAVVVFRAGDIGEHHEVVTLGDQAHGDSRDRCLDRNPRVHQGQRSAADGSHRTRAVGLQDVADDPNRVRKLLLVGDHGSQCALR